MTSDGMVVASPVCALSRGCDTRRLLRRHAKCFIRRRSLQQVVPLTEVASSDNSVSTAKVGLAQ